MRLFAGLCVQPVLAALVAYASFPYVLLDSAGRLANGSYPADVADSALSIALGVAILTIPILLFGVMPTAMWVVKRWRLSLALALAFGFGFGNLPVVLGAVLSGRPGPGGFFRTHAFASLIGLTGAAAFWVISIRGLDLSRDAGPANKPLQPTSGSESK